MRRFLTTRIQSFGYAFRGWWHVIRTQQNAWIHAVVSTSVVLAAEFFNTAIEAVVDLSSPSKHPLAEVGKDVGAAAVLIAALAAVAVGLLILGPPLWTRLALLFQAS
jgi:diacylglycerol kinase (ATP)